MKAIKILFVALFAIAFGAGVSAFDQAPEPVQSPSEELTLTRGAGEYRYILTSDDTDKLQDPQNWVLVQQQEEPDCSEADEIPCFVNYTGTDFDTFVSNASLPTLMGIAVETKEVIE